MQDLGFEVIPSQANFVTARFPDAGEVLARLARAGISVRSFEERPALAGCLRITLPGDPVAFDRLLAALEITS